MSTWYDVKLATLQKMFAADSTIITDESTLGYLAAMPYAANESLELLSTAGKYLVKNVTIVHNPVDNILAGASTKEVFQLLKGTKKYEGDGAHSYYVEVAGVGTLDIYVGNTLVETYNIDSKTLFTEYRGLLENANEEMVAMIFTTTYPMAIRNVALYRAIYETAEDVPMFRDKIPYYMPDLVDDFFQLDVQGIFYTGAYSDYIQVSEFYQEGDKTLILPYNMVGSFTVYYLAYPPYFSAETEDEYELPLAPEVVALMPLYMASQLYKDDDNGIATSYRNEFEVAFERLKNSANRSTIKEFTSISGWI